MSGTQISVYICLSFPHTYYDTVLSNVDVGTDLCCIDHTVLLDEDVIPDVQWKECHPGKRASLEEPKFSCLVKVYAEITKLIK